jgi:hypothetical protein
VKHKRRIVAKIGDICAEDHGGGALMRVGPYLSLEYTHGAESDFTDLGFESGSREERNACLTVYRVDVPTIGRDLCDCEAIRRDLDWCDWPALAKCVDLDPWEILEIALDPKRAWALYEIAAQYHGWGELDLEPQEIPYWRVTRMWTKPFRRRRKCRYETL